jgi:Ca2+-binding RTX toxin-like protein
MKPGMRAHGLVVLCTAGLLTMLLPAVGVLAGAPRCSGRRATIVGTARADVIRGTTGDDVILGLGGPDVINGRGGDDRICGGRGNDRLLGGAGSFDVVLGEAGNDDVLGVGGFDVLEGGPGDDLVDGGLGSFDVVSFFYASGPVTVDLLTGTATGGEGSDTLEAVEQVEGSQFNDQLTGDAGPNIFYAHGGDDLVDGGGGLDWISFIFAPGPVIVDLAAGTATGNGADTLTGLERVSGSRFNDTITGDAGPNEIDGDMGDDVLSGADGDDSLIGGDGNDLLDGGNGNDSLDGGPGTDTCTNGENVGNCEA